MKLQSIHFFFFSFYPPINWEMKIQQKKFIIQENLLLYLKDSDFTNSISPRIVNI